MRRRNGDQRLDHARHEHRSDVGRLGFPDPPSPPGRRQRLEHFPRPGSQRLRPDHLRRGQRRRRPDRLGLGRPGLSGPAQRAGPALQAALRVHGHRPQRPDPAQHGRQPGGGRSSNSATHAAHLGNSVSEVDPTYGLQNGSCSTTDAAAAFSPQVYGSYTANNTQVDNSSLTTPLDVRLIQLRNLLAGTRPQPNPGEPAPLGQPTRPGKSTATTTSS